MVALLFCSGRLFGWSLDYRMPSEVYRRLSLVRLLQLIVTASDKEALDELHSHRTVFYWHDKHMLRLVELVTLLRDSAIETKFGFAEEAYQHCLDKFSHFPSESSQTDCRNYFRAVLKKVPSDLSELETEQRVAEILQYMVTKHFKLSCKDRLRTLGDYSRYTWKRPQGEMNVFLPRSLAGNDRKQWLEEHLGGDVPPERQKRVQAYIDEQFADVGKAQYHENLSEHQGSNELLPWEYAERLEAEQLRYVIADEKMNHIDEQRPAIRKLGRLQLRALVLEIFEDLSNVSDTTLSQKYGLSKASYSRFAGRNWSLEVPDLWRNTARVLVYVPQFRALLEKSGLQGSIVKINQGM